MLVWRIPWTEEPGELQSTGSQRVGHDWAAETFTDLHTLSLHLSALCLTLGQLTDHESLRQDPPPLPASPEEMCSRSLPTFPSPSDNDWKELNEYEWHWGDAYQETQTQERSCY